MPAAQHNNSPAHADWQLLNSVSKLIARTQFFALNISNIHGLFLPSIKRPAIKQHNTHPSEADVTSLLAYCEGGSVSSFSENIQVHHVFMSIVMLID